MTHYSCISAIFYGHKKSFMVCCSYFVWSRSHKTVSFLEQSHLLPVQFNVVCVWFFQTFAKHGFASVCPPSSTMNLRILCIIDHSSFISCGVKYLNSYCSFKPALKDRSHSYKICFSFSIYFYGIVSYSGFLFSLWSTISEPILNQFKPFHSLKIHCDH